MHPTPEELRSLPLFADLGPEELEEVSSWFEVQHSQAGVTLTKEGEAGYMFYLLRDGTATVAHDDEEIRQLGPGDFFGELSIVGDGRRTASVRSTSAVSVWSMFGADFRSLEQQFPEVAERIRTAYA